MDVAVIAKALAGGVLIGAASALLLFTHGRIAGISGILGGLLNRPFESGGWRLWFLGGMVAGGVGLFAVSPGSFSRVVPESAGKWLVLLGAGLLVGFGTRLANGCTSGHGVCGIGRFSPRSIIATLTFLAVGMATLFVAKVVA